MSPQLYAVSVSTHILAATIWIGGMLFLSLVLIPGLRQLDDPALRSRLIQTVGVRFRLVGWLCLGLLLFTGVTNLLTRGISVDLLAESAFWSGAYGRTLLLKLGVFGVILLISATHDWWIGPRAGDTARTRPGSPEALRLRRMAIWFGRVNAALSIAMLALGVLLARGLSVF